MSSLGLEGRRVNRAAPLTFAFCTISTMVFGDSARAQEVAADSAGLEEVVVTAQRREENLQRAALAVSALDGDALTEASVTQATQLSSLAPSIQVAPAASSFTQIYLRGIGTFAANAFSEQGVAFNLDGVYLSRPAAPSAMFYDLERIEVLKGPQGTLYGRNASGGALNVITAKPKLGELGGALTAELGNYSTVKTSGALNIPTGERTALRIAGQWVERDGYFNDDTDDEATRAVRAQFLIDPANGFDVTLAADYAEVGGKGTGGTIMPLVDGDSRLGASDPRVLAAYVARPPTPPVPQMLAADDSHQDNVFYGASATLNADVGFATLTVIPSYRKTELDFRSYSSSFLIDVIENSEQSSIEARLAGTPDRWNWVVGAYYFDEDVSADQLYDQASNSTALQSDLGTRSYAAFGQLTYSLTDTFRVTGGVRYTRDDKEQESALVSRPFVGFVPPGPPAFVPIFLSIPSAVTSDVEFEKVTWKAGVEYDIGPQSLLYASVATGFKSGILYAATGRNHSEPENLLAYTLGSKNRFLEDTLQLNMELFYWDYEDQQLSHLGPVQVASTPAGAVYGPALVTENAGQASIYGAEAEILWQPTPDDLISFDAQYLDTEYDELEYLAYSSSGATPIIGCAVTPTTLLGATPVARIFDVDCSGRPLIHAPEWTLNLGYQHTFRLGSSGDLIVGLDARSESSRYLSLDFLDVGRQESFNTTNARVTYESSSQLFSVTAFVNNIEDEIVFSNSFASPVKNGTLYNQIRPPRTYGVRASLKF